MFSREEKHKIRRRENKEIQLIRDLIDSLSEVNRLLVKAIILPHPDQLDIAALHHTSDAQTSSSGTGEI